MDRDCITAWRLEVPLTKPYRLSFGDVNRYNTIVVAVTDGEGRTGLGEATVLTGYTDETVDDGWRVARAFAARLAGERREARRASVAQLAATHPFTATAFGTALEMPAPGEKPTAATATVPLVALVDSRGEHAIAAQFETLLAAGYRTIKIKVGFDVNADSCFVRDVHNVPSVAARASVSMQTRATRPSRVSHSCAGSTRKRLSSSSSRVPPATGTPNCASPARRAFR